MIALKYTVVLLLLLFCFRDSTCNNNFDPCSNPSNQNLTVPFREVATGSTSVYAYYRQNMHFIDTTNCYMIRAQYYSVYQNETATPMTFSLGLEGSLEHICNDSTVLGRVLMQDAFPTSNSLIIYSTNFAYVTVASVNVRGNFTSNNGTVSPINIHFGEATFVSNATIPSNQYQTDELVTYDNSPCTIRTRTDNTYSFPNFSRSSPVDVQFTNGTTLHFIFPTIMVYVSHSQMHKFYQQCTCVQANLETQLMSAEQTRSTPTNAFESGNC